MSESVPLAESTVEPTVTAAGIVRPQPLGAYRLPAGYLLVGTGQGDETDAVGAARRSLLDGRLPSEWPDEMAYYRHALSGDTDAALNALDLLEDNAITAANRFVLDGDIATYQRARSLAANDPIMATYLDTVAFVVGQRATPPAISADGEFAAFTASAHATVDLERGDLAAAIGHLEIAAQSANVVSKVITGLLLGQLATVQLDAGVGEKAVVTFDAALDALAGSELYTERAELHVAAGSMFQEMSEAAPRLMQKAIDHYQKALALTTANDAPETFAVANANLGLAYVTMPMQQASDQLRLGVAIQAMREALNYFTPETHPERWSATLVNLANALVYLPSKHQAENIAEAVELYEQLLTVRDRDVDPVGRARVLSNQGNALAHLGAFDDAKARLVEARSIFEEFEQTEAVQTVRDILDGIVRQETLNRSTP